jgi:hypothetical protein
VDEALLYSESNVDVDRASQLVDHVRPTELRQRRRSLLAAAAQHDVEGVEMTVCVASLVTSCHRNDHGSPVRPGSWTTDGGAVARN